MLKRLNTFLPLQPYGLLALLLIFLYSGIAYHVLYFQTKLDFYSFFSSAFLYARHDNPFFSMKIFYFDTYFELPGNLNPPFFLELFRPLTLLSLPYALVLWTLLSLCAGTLSVLISLRIFFSHEKIKKHLWIILIIFFSLLSSIITLAIGQISYFLFFFIIAGYYYYLRNKDALAGLCWGIIIAIKLFPGLLIIYALREKRYRVALFSTVVSGICCILPLLTHGFSAYLQYFNMIHRVLWYGANWNASLFGFIFRFFSVDLHLANVALIKCLYSVLFCAALYWYWKKMQMKQPLLGPHHAFCLTLVMMIVLSPLGWLYYFPMLAIPYSLIWKKYIQDGSYSPLFTGLWIASLFLVNFPYPYLNYPLSRSLSLGVTCFSIYFYGLIILLYLLTRPLAPEKILGPQHAIIKVVLVILLIGFSYPLYEVLYKKPNEIQNRETPIVQQKLQGFY